jgi:3-oxoadipate enol-lactonase
MIDMPFLDTPEVRLHYQFDPKPELPTLVFSNSLGTNLSLWDRQDPFFRNSFNILRFDTRGHGQSSIPHNPYCLADVARDALVLLDHLTVTKAAFCGISMGGMIGQWLAIHAPERFFAFCLCNSAAKIGSLERWNERIVKVRSQGMASVVPTVIERWYTPKFRGEFPDVVRAMTEMLLNTDPLGYIHACAAIRDMDQRRDISRIRTPTLVVYGDQDAVTPPEDAHFLLSRISHAQPLQLSAAHLSNIEAADAFNAGVLRFLEHALGVSNHG